MVQEDLIELEKKQKKQSKVEQISRLYSQLILKLVDYTVN